MQDRELSGNANEGEQDIHPTTAALSVHTARKRPIQTKQDMKVFGQGRGPTLPSRLKSVKQRWTSLPTSCALDKSKHERQWLIETYEHFACLQAGTVFTSMKRRTYTGGGKWQSLTQHNHVMNGQMWYLSFPVLVSSTGKKIKLSGRRVCWVTGTQNPGTPLPHHALGSHVRLKKGSEQRRTSAAPKGGIGGTVAMLHNDCNFIRFGSWDQKVTRELSSSTEQTAICPLSRLGSKGNELRKLTSTGKLIQVAFRVWWKCWCSLLERRARFRPFLVK